MVGWRQWGAWRKRGRAVRRSLWTRLVGLFVFMILLSMAGRALILLPPLRAALIDLSAGQTLVLADHAARRIDADLRLRLDTLDRVAAALPVADGSGRRAAWLAQSEAVAGALFTDGLRVTPLDRDGGGGGGGGERRSVALHAPSDPEDDQAALRALLVLEVPVHGPDGVVTARLTGRTRIATTAFLEPPPEPPVAQPARTQLVFPASGLVLADTGRLEPLYPGADPLIDQAVSGFRGGDSVTGGDDTAAAVVGVPGTDWLLVARDDMAEALRVFRSTQTIVVGATPFIAILLIATTLLMLRGFLKPLTDAARTIHRMANGEVALRPLPVVRLDEVGDLAQGFNILLARLDAATNQKVEAERLRAIEKERMETLLRQWMADTSHELRTPIAVLRAQIEAIQDGIFAADAKRLEILHGEVMGMGRLVDELFTLARSDIGQLDSRSDPVPVLGLLDELVPLYRERYAAAGLAIDQGDPPDDATPGQGVLVRGDAARLRQVFANLLENTLRYTDAGGRLRIGWEADADALTLRFDDTGPGVPGDALPRLFDRFFRVDVSRSRALGGSGIGLALCHSLIDAHGGTIAAAHSPLGGLRILIHLPRLKERS